MDGAASVEANGHRRVFRRPGSARGRVCIYWIQGRCSRYPCPFLHRDPSSASQLYGGVVPKMPQGYQRGGGGSLVWKKPTSTLAEGAGSGGGRRALPQAEVGDPAVAVRDARKSPPGAEVAAAADARKGSPEAEIKDPPGAEVAASVVAIPEACKNPPGEEVAAAVVAIPEACKNPPGAEIATAAVAVPDSRRDPDAPKSLPGPEVGDPALAIPDALNGPEAEEVGAAAVAIPDAPNGPAGICKFFIKGCCELGESCKFVHSWFVGDDFSLVTSLEGHQQAIKGIVLPSGSNNKLCSGSSDRTVRIWDCESGKCIFVAKPGGEVGCIISEGPWVFVGIPSAVAALNTQTGTEMKLGGTHGQVNALAFDNDMLFVGVQDSNILAWKFNTERNCFQLAASLSGHHAAVVSLLVGPLSLYSGSMDNTLRVWDLASLHCTHTLTDHTDAVMSLLCWDQFLISCSLDRTIKVWAGKEGGGLEVIYTHNEEHGVLVLGGTPDANGKPVLLCSCNDNIVRLYDLPSFRERGKIFSSDEVRAIQRGPEGLFFTGGGAGELKVWKWLTNEARSC